MGEGILRVCLLLMVMVGVNRQLQRSENTGIVSEGRDETMLRMKVRERTLERHQRRLEKEIAELEARQEALAPPASHLERKIQRHTCAVLALVVPALLRLRRQRWQPATAEHAGHGH